MRRINLMSGAATPPDRRVIIASLRDYVEQLREEGMEGVPAPMRAPVATAAAPRSAHTSAVSGAEGEISAPLTATSKPAARSAAAAGSSAPTELFYLYPGLEKTSDLPELREFIGDCQRCKLAPRRTNLVFGVGNPKAELMFVGEAPGPDENAPAHPFVHPPRHPLTPLFN